MQFVCSECGVVEGAADACPDCGEELYDLEVSADERFAYELFRLRRNRRYLAATGVSLFLSIPIVLGIVWALGVPPLPIDVMMMVVTVILSPVVHEALKLRLSERRREAEEHVLRQHRSDTMRSATATPIVLAVLLVLIHAGLVFTENLRVVIESAALIPGDIRSGERLWTIASSAVLHGSFGHVVGNGLGLLVFGVVVDLRLGRLRCAAIIIVTAICAALAQGFFSADPATPVVGASGFVYGLAGASLALLPSRKLVLASMGGAVALPAYVVIPLLVVVYTAFQILLDAPVAWIAHLGGFASGALMGWLFRNHPVPDVFRRLERRRQEALDSM